MPGPGVDGRIRLADGRVLEYWDGGDPTGRPVLYHPGTPVTRLLGRWGHDAAVAAGVRLISINRPGYGASTPITNVGGVLAGVGRDTAALAAHLGLDGFAVFGSSGGGPFAVATALAAPDAVRALGLVGAVGPWRLLDDPSTNPEDRACLALLDAGDAAGAWACLMATVGPTSPAQLVDAVFADDGSSLTTDAAYRAIWTENTRDVLAHPDGYTFDNVGWGGEWDIDPGAVSVPTLLFYGTEDSRCSHDGHGAWYADRIRDSELVVFPGATHIDVIDGHWPDVLAGLLAISR
jgi:pimeloyl-ACP methyl ester carboxylesterase